MTTNANNNIIKLLGIESLPDEQKIQIIQQAEQIVQQKLMLRVMQSLNDDQQKEFTAIMTAEPSDPQKLNEFVTSHVPDFEKWIVEETLAFKQELVDTAQNAEKDLE